MTFPLLTYVRPSFVSRFSVASVLSVASVSLAIVCILATTANSQDSQLVKAIGITPKQDVVFEKPTPELLKECKFERITNPAGFVVYHQSGRILRRFLDNNGDGKLDQWSYYDAGNEVYQEIDSDYDGKLNEYRWVGTSGSKWGLDNNQDGTIDVWKVISPEEVAFECFQAIKHKNANRFEALLLSPNEFDDMRLGAEIGNAVEVRLESARTRFPVMVRSQKTIGANTPWIYSSNGQPSTLPADGHNRRDLIIYENAAGFFEGSSSTQLALGSLVKIGDAWRMIELPEIVVPEKPFSNGGVFFPLPGFGASSAVDIAENDTLSKLYDRLESADQKLETAKGPALEKWEKEKANILVSFYVNTNDETSKREWIENLADSVSNDYQAGRFKGGIDFLNKFIDQNKDAVGLDYVKWSAIFASYGHAISVGSAKQREQAYKPAYDRLIADLTEFQKQFPVSEYSADALTQIAVHFEVANNDESGKAIQWYKQCQARFSNTHFGRRATGAIKRLSGVGEPVQLTGKTAEGKDFRLQFYRGKMVVLHFWESWCFSEDDVKQLAKLATKYKDDLVIVGCNIERGTIGQEESDATKLFTEFLKANPEVTWMQLHVPGGVEGSSLAHQLGISTQPFIALIDTKGKLVETGIGIGDLESEIDQERRRKK